MNNTNYFHFTLGPVQGFVSQARRTRDFWAGSFILSWLSAVAIKAVKHQDGEIEFPHADKDYMQWLVGEGKTNRPTQGSIPNRFKGLIAKIDPESFKPEEVTEAVQTAWQALADRVWEKDLGLGSEVAEIWERQIENFWDMNWVITPDKTDSAALDKRKNWRSYTPPAEAGVKCMMMDGWQELSGTKSPNRKELKKFWNAIRENGKNGISNDLKENEALCAMAFVKRRFSRHFEDLTHTMPQGWQLKGWKVPSAVPAVSYMAAVHWLKQSFDHADKSLLQAFHQEAYQLTGETYGEWETHIDCLHDYATDYQRISSLDGNVFHESQLENKNIFEDQDQAKKVSKLLAKINQTDGIKKASPFYAVLLMDGDSLGIHMSNLKKQTVITNALGEFTQGVPSIVQKNNGFLIYAGGDDVLAILPLEEALPCATAIRKHYQTSFKQADFRTSISAAIQFVHIKTALIKILRDSHDLLDNIAKDKTGRDAIAIRVWKPGGKQLQWTQPWETALNADTGKTHIEEIADTFTNEKVDEQLSNSFFYKIRERFSLLNPEGKENPALKNDQAISLIAMEHLNSGKSDLEPILSDKNAISLMAMEYLNSGKSDLSDIKNSKERKEAAEQRIGKLITQCRPHKRDEQGKCNPTNKLTIDGALLVRFLVQKGAE